VSLRPIKRADRDAANKYGVVVVLLCIAYVTSVTLEGRFSFYSVMMVQLVTLWLTFSASESPTARRLAGVACVGVGILAVLAAAFGDVFQVDQTVYDVFVVVSTLLYLIAPVIILRHLLRRKVVDARTIMGAVAIYIMLGMMFAFAYRAIGVFQQDTPFFGSTGEETNANFMFFSFITLTTTGYGNLVPATNPGQSVAVLEAIVGQLFLVTALAKIVNAWAPGFGQQPSDSGADEAG
jgi:hypothetical protein